LEKCGWEYVDMLWRNGAQNTGLSNCKLKSALKCTVFTMHGRQRLTDRRTDGHADRQADGGTL